jgi:hypothetical protein
MMLTIEKVDFSNPSQIHRFVMLPFRLYKDTPQFVPPLISDVKTMLNPKKHPYYEHSQAEFFIAVRDGRDVARLGVMNNDHFNKYHGKKQAHFTLFDSEDDSEAVQALFERAFDWAHAHGLVEIVGPRGLASFDGYGILIDGFQYRQMMNMYSYNFPYYARLVENLGFVKEVDFTSFLLETTTFRFPGEIKEIARRVMERNKFEVHPFKNKRELVSWAHRIGEAYNHAFVENWEYYPLTPREVDFMVSQLLTIGDPNLIKIITLKDEVVGFALAFPDISAALQRAKGRLTPWAIADILLEIRRTTWVTANGGGVLPQYHGRGANALLYNEMLKLMDVYHFKYVDIPQNAETASQMRSDILRMGGKPYRVHRVYRRNL